MTSATLFLVMVASLVATLALCGGAKDRDRRLNATSELPHAARRLRLILDEDAEQVRARAQQLDQLRRSPR